MIHFQGQEVGSCDWFIAEGSTELQARWGRWRPCLGGLGWHLGVAQHFPLLQMLWLHSEGCEAITRSGQRQASWNLTIETEVGTFGGPAAVLAGP